MGRVAGVPPDACNGLVAVNANTMPILAVPHVHVMNKSKIHATYGMT